MGKQDNGTKIDDITEEFNSLGRNNVHFQVGCWTKVVHQKCHTITYHQPTTADFQYYGNGIVSEEYTAFSLKTDLESQTWHLSTQLRSAERTGRRLLCSTTLLSPTLLSFSQVSISLVIHGLRWTVSGQVKAHVMLTGRNGGLAQSPSCDCGQRQTMNHIVNTCQLTEFEGELNLYSTKQKMTQSYG